MVKRKSNKRKSKKKFKKSSKKTYKKIKRGGALRPTPTVSSFKTEDLEKLPISTMDNIEITKERIKELGELIREKVKEIIPDDNDFKELYMGEIGVAFDIGNLEVFLNDEMENVNRRDIGRAKLLLHYVSEYKIIKDRLDILEGNVRDKKTPKDTLIHFVNKLFYSLPSIQDILIDYNTLFESNDVKLIVLYDNINRETIEQISQLQKYESIKERIFSDPGILVQNFVMRTHDYVDKHIDLLKITLLRKLCIDIFKYIINGNSIESRKFYNSLALIKDEKYEDAIRFSYIDGELAKIIEDNYFKLMKYLMTGYVYFL